ncbi:hypothetical protein D5R40_29510 [Okeania hirsuta]|uniref:Uncharacterized protein n=1 Tax=Okeania hirsuta TaxID=1458930 RepID=A0A3N6PGB0_9CYAN|nr:hypothetical protein D5R40_29510 [Okeania hirsuta]
MTVPPTTNATAGPPLMWSNCSSLSSV